MSNLSHFKFVFISSCPESWGGSEELWHQTAIYLHQEHHQIKVFKTYVDQKHRKIKQLQELGIDIFDIHKLGFQRLPKPLKNFHYHIPLPSFFSNKLIVEVIDKTNLYINKIYKSLRIQDYLSLFFLKYSLASIKPDLVLISQGENIDGLIYIYLCQLLGLNYAILSQKASDHIWPSDEIRPLLMKGYQNAKYCFFVSNHNLKLTQFQLGIKLPLSKVVKNPYQGIIPKPLSYPQDDGYFKLACVARLWILDKGQDILLNVLARDKWRERNLKVAFFGQGNNYDSLVGMVKMLELNNVDFLGFKQNIMEIWQNYHGLILPSRAEGLPLALVEAMMCGRMAIATSVGGIPELLEDEITGFIAQGASTEAVDSALEKAWQRRYEWEEMGKMASMAARKFISPHPEKDLGERLIKLSCKK
ncbi:glycosyltransferase [Geminocystis sp. GBBB08]|uniref:glycosyltransferase n=1 Tax=Geminocystis sp. GBBB08 TaxID=2604140 RepID=UPI0027E344C3|nr:glycosyltransferase [Geminocystis sp. GBBB08]MBL1210225.1 glycosyltransferase family 4 protein [Geminocystis sp. GBBB08]